MLWLTVAEPEPLRPVTVRGYVPAGVSGVVVSPFLPPPPHAAIARVSNNPAASVRNVARRRLTSGWHQPRTVQTTAAKAKASMTKPTGPGKSGLAGGRGRERGALTEGAVVVTVTVIFVAELPGVSVLGDTVQVDFEGAPAQVKLTLWLNPP
ncbi:MAG: hypothetical protein ABSA41_22460 [Terriglobia bacterium]